MTIGTRLYTWLHGKFVGEDDFGNRYFVSKKTDASGGKKRWVLYKKLDEPTLIPPAWHGWIHYRTDTLPTDTRRTLYTWEKSPQPNMTGTAFAYYPPGHPLKGGKREKATGDYQPWQP